MISALRFWIAAVLVLACTLAHADDKAKALELFDKGKRHFNVHEYREAIPLFKDAYKEFPDPVYLFNIAQSFRLLGNEWCAVSAQYYATFQREEKDKKLRDSVKKRREEMEACAKKYPQSKESELKPPTPPTNGTGATQPPPLIVNATPPTAIPPPATPTSPPTQLPPPSVERLTSNPKRTWGKILLIGGSVTVGLGALAWLTAGHLSTQIEECDAGPPFPTRCSLGDAGLVFNDNGYDELVADRNTNQAFAYISGVIGTAAIVTGFFLYRAGRAASRVTVVPARNGAAVAWSF